MKDVLRIQAPPEIHDARLVLGLTGWMDGGDVSTGVLDYLVANVNAEKFAEIDPEEFLIYNVPGSMQLSALFRPHTRIEGGRILALEEPRNIFHCDPALRLVLFSGHEPHVRWHTFADCILQVAEQCNVRLVVFVGSVSGIVPHTRPPRFHSVISDESMAGMLNRFGLDPANYSGPGSFMTYLSTQCAKRGIQMISLVAEIPSYINGRNVTCIEATVRKLNALLGLSVPTDDLKIIGHTFEEQLNRAVAKRGELAEFIQKLENEYDELIVDPKMADLKDWFEKQNIRLDHN